MNTDHRFIFEAHIPRRADTWPQHRARARMRRRHRSSHPEPPEQELTFEELARRLVLSGLCSPAILTGASIPKGRAMSGSHQTRLAQSSALTSPARHLPWRDDDRNEGSERISPPRYDLPARAGKRPKDRSPGRFPAPTNPTPPTAA